ncbi:hypothetical protein [Ereboglobus luteus]|uniref:Uncharacterized protein n=1 Tax=Ereboglobus luteus TaxID=1796921 RepID=A0A2U8E4M2_9BACT|nr:hypothetical protein [Ereboglobus luteus]AWI09715.1 hypothetical protein CKA38_11030 [Ereboglobus luteus]
MKSAFRTPHSAFPLLAALALLAAFSLQPFSLSVLRAGAPAPAPMSLRLVSLNNGQWMDKNKTAEVRREVDRIVSEGFNAISIGTYKFMPAYFIDYTKTPYPEAQQFDPKKSASQLETLRANIRYAKSKGIQRVVSRSYSHYCPLNFWEAHQAELNPGGIFKRFLENAHQNNIYKESLQKRKAEAVVPHAQWTNPVFRNFFIYSTSRMLDLIPELDGFLNAYAEAAWTLTPDTLRADKWKSWKENVDYAATDANFVDYCNTLYALLQKKRGDRLFLGMRDWYVKPETLAQLKMPRSQLYMSIKYAGYDQPLVNYPPWGKDLLDAGYSVILDIIVFDAEHPHPVYWYDGDIIEKTFANMRAGGFTGIAYQDYQLKSKTGDALDHPVRRLTQKTVGAAIAGKPFTNADAIAFLRPHYRDGAEPLLRSLKAVALAQESFIKLSPAWFWRGDGLTPGGLDVPRLWKLNDEPEAPSGMAFVRQNAISVPGYVAATLSPDPASAIAKLKSDTGPDARTPVELIAEMRRHADDSVTAALEFRAKAPAKAPYLRDLVASAFIHQQLVARDTAFLEAAIAYYRAGANWDGRYHKDRNAPLAPRPGVDVAAEKAACLDAMNRLVYHDQIMAELLKNYAPRRPTRRNFKGYPESLTMAQILGIKLAKPALDQTEYNRIETQILGK